MELNSTDIIRLISGHIIVFAIIASLIFLSKQDIRKLKITLYCAIPGLIALIGTISLLLLGVMTAVTLLTYILLQGRQDQECPDTHEESKTTD